MEMKYVLMVTAAEGCIQSGLVFSLRCSRGQFLEEMIVDSTPFQEYGGDGRRHLTRPRSML